MQIIAHPQSATVIYMPHKHPDPMFHTDADYHASVERAKRDCLRQRLEAGADLATGQLKPLTRVAPPLRPARHPACMDALDTLVETYQLRPVVHCLAQVLAANGYDISTLTISELAECEEVQ